MKICNLHFDVDWRTTQVQPGFDDSAAQLVLVFGSRNLLQTDAIYQAIRQRFAHADIVLASTSGEIVHDEVVENTVVATAIQFNQATVQSFSTHIAEHSDSYHAGAFLRNCFTDEGLKILFVISDGTLVNGSELVQGLTVTSSDQPLLIAGGLAGDGELFSQTVTGLNAVPSPGNVVAIGLYGDGLHASCASFGGWDEFGPLREVTKSHKNVLYEIDGRNALDLYKEYLGPFKTELPGSALLFPLAVQYNNNPVITRTILSIDEENQSMIFAGNIPEGSKVRLMKANFDRLILASQKAAETAGIVNTNGTNVPTKKFILPEKYWAPMPLLLASILTEKFLLFTIPPEPATCTIKP
jgi:hypothetical protein